MLLTTFDPFAYEFDRRARRALGSADYRRLARMDAIRRENDIELRFDLPGIDPESIDVTVDRALAYTSSGAIEYAGARGNELWVALIEKAYAQINEEGWLGHAATNSYAAIDGGYSDLAISQHGERMPAKSTYFYPKLIGGLVINPLA